MQVMQRLLGSKKYNLSVLLEKIFGCRLIQELDIDPSFPMISARSSLLQRYNNIAMWRYEADLQAYFICYMLCQLPD